MILHQEGMTDAQEADAHKVLEILTVCYPGHPWSVRVATGIIFIRHLGFEGGNWGMNIRTTEVDHDSAVMRHKIIMLAGEWLERAGLARGRADETETVWVEGVPAEDQPAQSKPPLDVEVVVAKMNGERKQIMPQAKRMLKGD